MKNLFTAVILGIALAGVSIAQASGKGSGGSVQIRMAVVEFTPGADASGMTAEGKRQLQTGIAAALAKTRELYVYDVRHTRTASQGDLAAINGTSTASAVKVGKQLGVAFVVTGTVVEYNTKGSATVKARVVDVATGKIRFSEEYSQQATMTMTMTSNAATAEMQAKVLRPLILKLSAAIVAEF